MAQQPRVLWEAVCRYHENTGRMMVTYDGVYWRAEGANNPQLLVAWEGYKKHMISPASHPKALVKIDLQSGASVKFEVVQAPNATDPPTPAAARELAVQAKDVISAAKRAATEAPPAAAAAAVATGSSGSSHKARAAVDRARREVAKGTQEQLKARVQRLTHDARKKLLQDDPILQSQHAQMVGEGLIDEEEFWQARRQMQLDKEAEARARRPGLPSNILAEIEARAQDPESERAKKPLTLRAADIQFLFELYPGLKVLYRRQVPEELSEKQFWQMVIQSIKFHKQRREVIAVDEYSSARAIPKMHVSKQDLRNVDPVFNLDSDFGDHAHKSAPDENYTDAFKEVVDKYNRQASLLVKSHHRTSMGEHVDMPDLHDEGFATGIRSNRFQKLTLKNLDAYHQTSLAVEDDSSDDVEQRRAEDDDGDDDVTEAARDISIELSKYTPSLATAVPSPNVARAVLDVLTDKSKRLRNLDGGPSLSNFDPEKDSQTIKAYVEFSRVSEFLRHFYAFFDRMVSGHAAAAGPQVEQQVKSKLERLVSKIEAKAQELSKVRREAWAQANAAAGEAAARARATSQNKFSRRHDDGNDGSEAAAAAAAASHPGTQLASMLLPFQRQLEHALDVYDTHERTAKGGRGGGSNGWTVMQAPSGSSMGGSTTYTPQQGSGRASPSENGAEGGGTTEGEEERDEGVRDVVLGGSDEDARKRPRGSRGEEEEEDDDDDD